MNPFGILALLKVGFNDIFLSMPTIVSGIPYSFVWIACMTLYQLLELHALIILAILSDFNWSLDSAYSAPIDLEDYKKFVDSVDNIWSYLILVIGV